MGRDAASWYGNTTAEIKQKNQIVKEPNFAFART